MIRSWARRCRARRGHVTWQNHFTQHGFTAFTCAAPLSARQDHLLGLYSRLPYSKYSLADPKETSTPKEIVSDPAAQVLDSPEDEVDHYLDLEDPGGFGELYIQEQEAQFRCNSVGLMSTIVKRPCPVCGRQHALSFCPMVFEDSPIRGSSAKDHRTRLAFQKRLDASKKLRETVMYIRKKFTVRGRSGTLIPILPSATQDAPLLARSKMMRFPVNCNYMCMANHCDILTEFLSKFSWNVRFLRSSNTVHDDQVHRPVYSCFTGYYPTTDDDGRPFLIVFANSAHFDDNMLYGMSSCPPDLSLWHLPKYI